MRCRAAIRGGVAALAVATACCNINNWGPGYSNGYGNVGVDGTDTQMHAPPPVGYECYPHYFVGDGYVYEVQGHYYKEHNGNWSVLRNAPSLVRYQEPEVSHDRRCVGYPH
jgi:hypothetical protein